ncbi:MAG: ABC transporter permease [Clostridia bacterium]|nr:ABC transporter permease [Clostridia bacterium]
MAVNRGLYVLFRKELADHFTSKRFIIIMLIVAATCLAGVYSAGLGIREAVAKESSEFVFLRLFTSSGGSLPSFATFISFLGPLVGLSMGFDAINGERNGRTLSRLLAQPIHRDDVINAKFLAGLFILVMMVLTLGLAVAGFGIILTGIPPTWEEVARMFIFMLITIVYIALWLAVSQLFSLLFKQTATSALACIALWLFFVVFVNLFAGIIADGLYPVTDQSPAGTVLKNYNLRHNISRLSPTLLYDEAVVTILNPGIRSLGLVLTSQVEGAIPGALPFGQSLLLVWPHVTGIIAATMICFAVSYVSFMRQEIRA